MIGAAVVVALGGCSDPSGRPAATAAPPGAATGTSPAATAKSSRTDRTKVMLIPMENQAFEAVIGSPNAPYLNGIAARFGLATAMDAGYPAACPSLAAYLLLTGGDTHGICDDADPAAHPITGPSVFSQLSAAGREWRVYAESMPAPCAPTDSPDGLYLVRHTAAPYYTSETRSGRCARWDLPLGTTTTGNLADAVRTGRLPALSLVVPNACNDMHGAAACPDQPVRRGDQWLSRWLPQVMAGADYRSGRLVVVITWDEGSDTDNHIPTLVVSPATTQRTVTTTLTQCSTLRTVQELLGLPPLGCAVHAPSLSHDFALR